MNRDEKILIVDDEPLVLEALRRSLRPEFEIEVEESPVKGLDLLAERGPFAVVVSDLRMPNMTGIEFLAQARTISPDTIRIMLSGNADLDSALAAVNENNIFRFLTKPCPVSILSRTLIAALRQYRLVTAERQLLQETLMGSVTVLTEILAVIYPAAFRQSARVRGYVKLMAQTLGLPDSWQFEVAALLSQIGRITLPVVTTEKIYSGEELSAEESRLYTRHPSAARAFLRNIPRLGPAAEMIAGQQKPYRAYEQEAGSSAVNVVALGAQMIHVAIGLDRLIEDGHDLPKALESMRDLPEEYNPELLQAMAEIGELLAPWRPATVLLADLTTSMVADEDIRAVNGLLLVPKGGPITFLSLERVRTFASELGVIEPMSVLILKDGGELLRSFEEVRA
jgi:CheY-like chemotaxis protein